MNFTVCQSSDNHWSEDKEITTLEELVAFVREHQPNGIIIHIDDDRGTLEIYDDYRE